MEHVVTDPHKPPTEIVANETPGPLGDQTQEWWGEDPSEEAQEKRAETLAREADKVLAKTAASGGGRTHTQSPQGNPNRITKAMYDALRAAFDQLQAEYVALLEAHEDLKAQLAAGGSAPGHLPSLGLEPPYDRAKLDARYKLLIKHAHPDTPETGDTAWAQVINADYEKGKAWLESQPEPVPMIPAMEEHAP